MRNYISQEIWPRIWIIKKDLILFQYDNKNAINISIFNDKMKIEDLFFKCNKLYNNNFTNEQKTTIDFF